MISRASYADMTMRLEGCGAGSAMATRVSGKARHWFRPRAPRCAASTAAADSPKTIGEAFWSISFKSFTAL